MSHFIGIKTKPPGNCFSSFYLFASIWWSFLDRLTSKSHCNGLFFLRFIYKLERTNIHYKGLDCIQSILE